MAKKNNYASTTHATGYNSENDAIATALAGAAAMKEYNPDIKITIAVGPTKAIEKMHEVSIENKQ